MIGGGGEPGGGGPGGVPGRGALTDFDERVLEDLVKPGDVAPDFSLLSADGKTTIRLADYRNKRPVVLIFGSCT